MNKKPIVATETMARIAVALEKDQGALFRHHLGELLPQAKDVYREDEDVFRSHLGASLIGRDCARAIWYGWHWVTRPSFPGRIIRLFNRGHLEEPRFAALLKMIGCTVWQYDDQGNQFRIKGYKGHYGGGLDSVILGIPEMPTVAGLGEFKTHNDKSFQKVKDEGVRSAKFDHYVQQQQYMGKHNLPFSLYMAVNKNDDEIYAEVVPFDQENFQAFENRAQTLIDMRDPPPRINNSPGWYQCRFCDHKDTCHGTKLPERNCRTCIRGFPVDNGEWVCFKSDTETKLSKEDQMAGCGGYSLNPAIKMK